MCRWLVEVARGLEEDEGGGELMRNLWGAAVTDGHKLVSQIFLGCLVTLTRTRWRNAGW